MPAALLVTGESGVGKSVLLDATAQEASASGATVLRAEGVDFDYASFINALITFLITAAVVYFIFVAPMNRLKEYQSARAGGPKESEESDLDVLKAIRDELQAQRTGGSGRGRDPLR